MELKEILHELSRCPNVIVELTPILTVPQFQTGEDVSSIESMLLVAGGHAPIKRFYFDEKKLKKWCEENNLRYFISDIDRTVHFKII